MADYFRLLWLWHEGGGWIDADVPAFALPLDARPGGRGTLQAFDSGYGDLSYMLLAGGAGL